MHLLRGVIIPIVFKLKCMLKCMFILILSRGWIIYSYQEKIQYYNNRSTPGLVPNIELDSVTFVQNIIS